MYSDEELVTRSKNGNLQAFEELVCRYERKIYSVAYRLMGSYDDANDLAQEAFLKAFLAINSFRGDSSFSTWLCRIVTNLCRDELRKRYRISVESLDQKICLGDVEIKKQIPSSEPGPEEIYEKHELQQELQDLLTSLSPEFRLAVVLRDLQGFTYQEIAEQMECSVGTVKSRISRARSFLKEKLLAQREQYSSLERLHKVKGGKANGM
ncbi:MAG: sigma-70 family RNA polymerase sigma factor [Clostridia bacterium]|nr:sigma-70 family RNA polymerase sigma factor [Clostridia bacterium]MDD4665926.1 sigma-70 family RNA polymerase sigma factor [Clostridia bacterium]